MPAGLGVRVLRRLLKPLIETGTLTFFVRDLQEDQALLPTPSGIVVRQLQPADRDVLLYGADPERTWEALRARFDSDDVCFAALDEQGRALHTRWVTLTGAYLPELDRYFVPGADSAYAYDAYSRPDARGRGLDAAVRKAVFAAMRARGKRHVYSYARGDNPPGLRAAARHQREAGTVRYVRLFRTLWLRFGIAGTGLSSLLRPPRR
jgi:GNAT superfamily N-acetyltransferase